MGVVSLLQSTSKAVTTHVEMSIVFSVICVHGVKFSLTYWPQVEIHDCTQNFKSNQLSMYNHRYFRLTV